MVVFNNNFPIISQKSFKSSIEGKPPMWGHSSLSDTGTGPWNMSMSGSGSPVALESTTSVQFNSYLLYNTSLVEPSDAYRMRSTFVFVLVPF